MKIFIFFFFGVLIAIRTSLKLSLKRKSLSNEGYVEYSPMTLTICLGTPPQCFDLAYDTGSYFIWVPDESLETFYQKYFNPDNSSTFLEELVEVYSNETDDKIIGYEAIDTLSLNPMNPHNRYFFNFVIAQSFYYSPTKADGNLGLARNYTHPIESVGDSSNIKRFSFMEMLNSLNIINRNIFYHRYTSHDAGELFFGEELVLKSNENLFTCKCSYKNELPQRFNDFWNCQINKMILENIETEFEDSYAIFSTAEEYIIAPFRIGVKIMERYKTFFPDNCVISSQEDYQMECKEANFSSLPSLTFEFGDYQMIIPPENLFIKSKDIYIFAVKASNTNNFWIFGDPALKIQPMMFDQDNNVVGFISTTQTPKSYSMTVLLWFIVAVLVGVFLFFTISAIMRYRTRKNLEESLTKSQMAIPINEIQEK